MNKLRPAAPFLRSLQPYDPKYLPAEILLSANESSENIPREVRDAISQKLAQLPYNRYPDPLANLLRDQIAEAEGLTRDQVIIGNGGDELLYNIALAWGGEERVFLDLPPAFSVYGHNARLAGSKVVSIPREADYSIDEEAVLERVSQGDIDYLIVTSPNNPTGNLADPAFVVRLLETSDTLVVIDEAYGEFAKTSFVSLIHEHKNVAVLRTFSKAYRLAGVRLGYLMGDKEVIQELSKVRQPYSVDALSQCIGSCVYEQRSLFEQGIEDTITKRAQVSAQLKTYSGITVYPSAANYILFKVKDAAEVWQKLYDHGILVRDFSASPYLTDCLRVSIGSTQENKKFLTALKEILAKR